MPHTNGIRQIRLATHLLRFKERVFTSRGALDDHPALYIIIEDDNGRFGIGECAPLSGLSPEYGNVIQKARTSAQEYLSGGLDSIDFTGYSSLAFAFQCADLMLQNGLEMVKSPFAEGLEGITINGLVWMGDIPTMLARAREKYDLGFRCLKFKIGKDTDAELRMIAALRQEFGDSFTLRVDANCAYTADEYLTTVEPRLHDLGVHSIEQPVSATDLAAMRRVCAESRVPVALDEALIGTRTAEQKQELLLAVRPQYIILKPTLCGGLRAADEWISAAKDLGIGYWATSALESNIGLTAIAQWAFTIGTDIPQGLGTGQIYANNFNTGATIRGPKLYYDKQNTDGIQTILSLPSETIR